MKNREEKLARFNFCFYFCIAIERKRLVIWSEKIKLIISWINSEKCFIFAVTIENGVKKEFFERFKIIDKVVQV